MAEEYTGYCVKEKKQVTMVDVEIVTTKNGRRAAKGKCPSCGTTVMKFLTGEKAPAAPAPAAPTGSP